MKEHKNTAWSVYVFTLIRLLSPIEQAQADVKPGDTITQTTMTEAEALLPASIRWMVEQGMSVDVRQTKQVVLPHAYMQATQQHAGQVKLTVESLSAVFLVRQATLSGLSQACA